MSAVARRILVVTAICMAMASCSEHEKPAETELAPVVAEPAVDSRPNAATEYARIYQRLGRLFLEPLAGWQTGTSPTPEEESYLNALQEHIRAIIGASEIERCDFDVDYSQGVETEAPHSRWLLHFARLLNYDAQRFAKQPSGASGAAERLATILRLAKHASHDDTMITRLVGYACVDLASGTIIENQSRIIESDVRAELRAEAQRTRDSSLFTICPVIPKELGILKTTIEQSRGSLNFGLGEVPIADSEKPALIAEVERSFSAAAQYCDAPDAQQQLTKIDEGVKDEKIRQLTPRWGQFVKQMDRARSRLDAAIAAIK